MKIAKFVGGCVHSRVLSVLFINVLRSEYQMEERVLFYLQN